ncbi:MAG TPA: TonB family protein [Pyrinomonadaceae bacterium]|jgi:TonB family protein
MLVHGLRLLVALITFAVGVTASRLGGSETRLCGKRVYSHAPVMPAPVVVAAPSMNEPPRHACHDFDISGGILNGKALSKPAPAYPPAAKAAGVQGTVTVSVVLDESGNVLKAEAQSGPRVLRDAAVAAARQARFSPTRLSGQPMKVSGVITYNFVLQ